MSARKTLLIRVLCFIFSCFAATFLNYFVAYELERRLGIYSGLAQFLLLLVQLVVIYAILQLIFFKKLTRVEIILFSAAYAVTVISVLFLRYNVINMQGAFIFSPFSGHWPVSWNPISFISDAVLDPSSILVSLLNIVLFIPFRPILEANKLHPRWWLVITGFLGIELLQYILNAGSFDLGDIVLYFAGYLTGYGLIKFCRDMDRKAPSTENTLSDDE